MREDSSGSIEVPSKDPHEIMPWDEDGWIATHRIDGPAIDEGGMGVVYPVIHAASGERRALKRPLRTGDDVRARFKREIELQRKLRHRNVMPILEFGPNFGWFTMPLADRTLLRAAREMSDEEIARMVVHVARGLEAAHADGSVHRDVKPSNILERAGGSVSDPADWVVADFGIVRKPSGQTTDLKTRHALGTEGYMAPEVGIGGHARVTAAADVYSLGRSLAWATTGIHPVRYEPLEGRGPWAQLVAEMTEFEPGARLQTMSNVVARVVDVLASVRAARSKAWGQHLPSTLSPAEEVLLATVFEHAWEPDDAHGEIAVTLHNLEREFSSKAGLRIWLRRLVGLGYLRSGWYQGRDESIRTYIPTQLAWDWALKNNGRIQALLEPPKVEQAEANVVGGPDDDIPF